MTWMIIWMLTNARSMKGDLTAGLAAASTATAVTVFAAVAVAREGFETVMFLLSAGNQSEGVGGVLLGAAFGFGAAAIVGIAIYARGLRLNLQRFFLWTGVALVLFAASSFAYGVHELREYMGVEGFFATELWRTDVAFLAKDHVVGGVLGMFGWMPHPELIRFAAYVVFAVPMLAWFLRPAPTTATRRAVAPTAASAAVVEPAVASDERVLVTH
jgi:high-affinity iron transporter